MATTSFDRDRIGEVWPPNDPFLNELEETEEAGVDIPLIWL